MSIQKTCPYCGGRGYINQFEKIDGGCRAWGKECIACKGTGAILYPETNGDKVRRMSDKELAQVTFAMRIFDHDVDISYSTREPANIRDHMATLGVTTMSAESKTEPGGYYTYPQALEQFHVSDERTAVEVEKALKAIGREPVWKDWDASFDHMSKQLHTSAVQK